MARGGYREMLVESLRGIWEKSTTIRVPIALAEQLG